MYLEICNNNGTPSLKSLKKHVLVNSRVKISFAQFRRCFNPIHAYSINLIRRLLRSRVHFVLREINRFLSRTRGSIPVGPSERTLARTNERNRDYKAFISAASHLRALASDLHKNRGAPGRRAERKNGFLIQDQIMILRGSRLTRRKAGRGL